MAGPNIGPMHSTRQSLLFIPLWLSPALAQPEITITLYDRASLAPSVRETMKNEVVRILDQAGVRASWVECEIADTYRNFDECSKRLDTQRLMLQLLPGRQKDRPRAAGMALVTMESSVSAWVYPDVVRELAGNSKWDAGELLGHAAAHELGHLLMRTSEHSPAGIMRARWEPGELRGLSHAGLIFLPGQLGQIQARASEQALLPDGGANRSLQGHGE